MKTRRQIIFHPEAVENDEVELSVPEMMDMLDQIYRGAREEEYLAEFAEALDDAMGVLADLQRQAFEVMEEIETEKRLYGSRYASLPHKVC